MDAPKRGLQALLSATSLNPNQPAPTITAAEVPLSSIRPNPDQPRTHFDPVALDELAASIKARGLIQPVVVRPIQEPRPTNEPRPQGSGQPEIHYELIAGERRWRASQIAGLTTIPVVVKAVFDERDILLLSLVENLQRDDLNPVEEAAAYAKMCDKFNLTHDQIASGIGKSRAHITNLIRILELPPSILDAIKSRKLTPGHAKVLLTLPDAKLQSHFAAKTQAENLTVRDLERLITGPAPEPAPSHDGHHPARKSAPRSKGSRNTRVVSPEIQDLERQLREHFGTRVTIEENSRKGRIVIEFFSPDDLHRITRLMQL
ncbi:MAG TPA: ParB/RepB/Spo0J family partition protein [Planctomycetota bacterium]|nr:ParB/RepB/Spo0J family partition protein [Planctomycetota bacterium]